MLQAQRSEWADVEIVTGDSRTHTYKPNSIKLVITSPPYANGLDYVTNYKLEMAWLDKASNYGDLRKLRDKMVSCDNISRTAIREFAKEETRFEDEWLSEIVENIRLRVQKKGTFRRNDMHLVVKKYFEDLYQTFDKVYAGLDNDGRFVIVIGDSLIAGTYLPTDLILAKIGERIGFNIEDIQLARTRRSGQRRSFELRETIVTLTKGKPQKTVSLDDFVFNVS
jgi:DNA modification methylase